MAALHPQVCLRRTSPRALNSLAKAGNGWESLPLQLDSLEIEPDSAGTCGESADFCIGSFGNLETLETLGH